MLFASAAATVLCACSTTQHYERPSLSEPDQWHDTNQLASPEWPAADWWRAFGAPQLDTLMAQAQQHNFDLTAASDRVRQADAGIQIAHAPLLPSVGPDVQWTHGQVPQRQSQAVLTAGYEVDFWGKNRAGVEAAEQ